MFENLDIMYLLSQVAGAFGIITGIFIMQQRTHKAMLINKIVTDCMWVIQYILIGNFTSMAISLIAIFRSFVFAHYEKKEKTSPKWWLLIFVCLALGSTCVTWKSWISIFPMLGSFVAVVSFWQRNPKYTVYFQFIISVFMLINHCFAIPGKPSYTAAISECLVIVSATITLIRNRIESKKKEIL